MWTVRFPKCNWSQQTDQFAYHSKSHCVWFCRSPSPDVILCGWLGSKHQLTTTVTHLMKSAHFTCVRLWHVFALCVCVCVCTCACMCVYILVSNVMLWCLFFEGQFSALSWQTQLHWYPIIMSMSSLNYRLTVLQIHFCPKCQCFMELHCTVFCRPEEA